MSHLKKELEIAFLTLAAFFTGAFAAAKAEEELPAETVQIYEDLKSKSGVAHPEDFEKWISVNPQKTAQIATDLYDSSEFRDLLPNDLNESLTLILQRRQLDGSYIEQPQVEKKPAN